MDEYGVSSQPSLYLAFRVSRLVHTFRHRLQERVLVRKRCKNPFGGSQRRGLRLRASSEVEKTVFPCRLTIKTESVSPVEHEFNGQWANSLLRELDGYADRKSSPLAEVAANDKLFLSHSTDTLVETVSPATSPQHAAYLFDLSSLLINRLDVFRSQQPTETYHSSSGFSDLQHLRDESFIANLLHLLLRLQRRLFQVLVNQSLQQIEEITRYWREYWQQQRKLGNNWFNEWPDGRRPLSTTWPWNIRPSLVILWGVCWMFYNNFVAESEGFFDTHNMEEYVHTQPELPPGNILYSQAEDTSSQRVQAADALVVPHNVVNGAEGINHFVDFGGSAPPSPNDAVALLGPVTSERQFPDASQAFDLSDRGMANGEPGYPSINQNDLHFQPLDSTIHRHQQRLLNLTTPVTTSGVAFTNDLTLAQGQPSIAEPLDLRYNPSPFLPLFPTQQHLQTPYAPPASNPSPGSRLSTSPVLVEDSPSLGHDMATTDAMKYISPTSNGLPRRSYSIEESSPSTTMTGDRIYPMPPVQPRLAVRREQDPPKNEQGQMYCDHQECQSSPPTFRRLCEWNKHMDKHDRPYKCKEPGCDKIRGFTYSGGLLRHQREVHKKNTKAKSPRMCPYTDCNRSTGTGFTRQENLKEHLRRRHLHNDTSPELLLAKSPDVEATTAPSMPALPLAPIVKKRKRSADHHTTSTATSDDGSEYSGLDLREEVKRLRLQVRDRNRRVQDLEEVISNIESTFHQARR